MPQQPNMNQMMRQVQQMQAEMEKAQESLKDEWWRPRGWRDGDREGERRAGGVELKIDPEAVDPEDVELLQDMVQAAVNEAVRSAQELAAEKLGAVTGGLRRGGPGRAGHSRALMLSPL